MSWQNKGKEWLKRSQDQHLRVAITGLRQSGKTTLMTALIDQLLHVEQSTLNQWTVNSSGRLKGIREENHDQLHIPAFPYHSFRQTLTEGQWPESTQTLNETRLVIRYQSQNGLRRRLSAYRDLWLDLIDYPGEWLLDLPLLDQSYASWSKSVAQMIRLMGHQEDSCISQIAQLDPKTKASEYPIGQIAEHYRQYLRKLRDEGGYYLTPGRQLLPGELKGAPVLDFFPWLGPQPEGEHRLEKDSCYELMCQRYEYYCKHIVLPFYRDYFKGFDRQVVLVNVLDALNHGAGAFSQLQYTLNRLLESFRYGHRGLLNRFFVPKIDRVLFAATQADRITLDQYPALSLLTDDLLGQSIRKLRFNDIEYKTMVTSAVMAAQQGTVKGQPAVVGTEICSGRQLKVFPGGVPSAIPDPSFWAQHSFNFPSFAPPEISRGDLFPQMRLDALLEYLLGDKLQ